jgi:hypothetical protein
MNLLIHSVWRLGMEFFLRVLSSSGRGGVAWFRYSLFLSLMSSASFESFFVFFCAGLVGDLDIIFFLFGLAKLMGKGRKVSHGYSLVVGCVLGPKFVYIVDPCDCMTNASMMSLVLEMRMWSIIEEELSLSHVMIGLGSASAAVDIPNAGSSRTSLMAYVSCGVGVGVQSYHLVLG